MYRPGHYGAALAAYAPLGAVAVATGALRLALLGGVGALALAMLPDFDLRIPGLSHRGITHTLWFALAAGAITATVLMVAGGNSGNDPTQGGLLPAVSPATLAAYGGVVATVTLGSHIAADALTPMGVRPFAPISRRRYTLDVATADSLVANYLLLGIGVAASAGALWLGVHAATLFG